MNVGLDLDNTCLAFQSHWIERYEHWFDREVDPTRINEWDCLTSGTHFPTSAHFFSWAAVAGVWDDMPYIPGAQAAIDELLYDGHTVTLVTARHGNQVPGTERWFAKQPWYGDRRFRLATAMTRKSAIACGVYVDDAPHVLEELMEAGKNVIRFAQPWNEHVDCLAAADWHEALELIKESE